MSLNASRDCALAKLVLGELLKAVANVISVSESLLHADKTLHCVMAGTLDKLVFELDAPCREALRLLPTTGNSAEIRERVVEVVSACQELAGWCEEKGKHLSDLLESYTRAQQVPEESAQPLLMVHVEASAETSNIFCNRKRPKVERIKEQIWQAIPRLEYPPEEVPATTPAVSPAPVIGGAIGTKRLPESGSEPQHSLDAMLEQSAAQEARLKAKRQQSEEARKNHEEIESHLAEIIASWSTLYGMSPAERNVAYANLLIRYFNALRAVGWPTSIPDLIPTSPGAHYAAEVLRLANEGNACKLTSILDDVSTKSPRVLGSPMTESLLDVLYRLCGKTAPSPGDWAAAAAVPAPEGTAATTPTTPPAGTERAEGIDQSTTDSEPPEESGMPELLNERERELLLAYLALGAISKRRGKSLNDAARKADAGGKVASYKRANARLMKLELLEKSTQQERKRMWLSVQGKSRAEQEKQQQRG